MIVRIIERIDFAAFFRDERNVVRQRKRLIQISRRAFHHFLLAEAPAETFVLRVLHVNILDLKIAVVRFGAALCRIALRVGFGSAFASPPAGIASRIVDINAASAPVVFVKVRTGTAESNHQNGKNNQQINRVLADVSGRK